MLLSYQPRHRFGQLPNEGELIKSRAIDPVVCLFVRVALEKLKSRQLLLNVLQFNLRNELAAEPAARRRNSKYVTSCSVMCGGPGVFGVP